MDRIFGSLPDRFKSSNGGGSIGNTAETGKVVVEDREPNNEDPRTGMAVTSRVLIVRGRRTSARLEDEMWASFKDIAEGEGCSVHELASYIYAQKKAGQSFTSAIRVFVMLYYRDAAKEAGH